MTTISKSGPKISPKNTVFSFTARIDTVLSSARTGTGPQRLGFCADVDQNVSMTRAPSATVRDALSVSLTVGFYGVAFGATSVAAGFSVLQSCLFSLLTFSGASQFAAVGVVASGGAGISAIATAALLGTRNALYGIQMAPLVKVKGLKRVAAAQITIDESTGVALAQASRGTEAMRYGFWLTGTGVFLFWNVFTFLGAFGAKSLGDPASWGLDAAVPAAFLGLVWPRLETMYLRLVAASAMAFALLVTPWLPAGLPIIASVFVAVAFGWRER